MAVLIRPPVLSSVWTKNENPKRFVALSWLLNLIVFGVCLTVSQPQALANLFNDPDPSPGRIGEPNRGDGGGTRPGTVCEHPFEEAPVVEASPLIALVPTYDHGSGGNATLVYGTTLADHPTVWFYVAYAAPFTATFTLWDSQNRLVYEGAVSLPEQPGVIQLTLPTTRPALAPGTYHWYFKINCESTLVTYVDGLIHVLPPNLALAEQLENMPLQEQLILYGENGIWHEAIATAAALQSLNPADPAWATLLQEVGLGAIAPAPRADCCQWVSSSEPAPH